MSEPESFRTIRTDYLARVEGEGAMYVKLDGTEVVDVKLRIYEPPRFFEALLRGRSFMEAPDITARICGICPVAYQTSAVRAMEDACGVTIDEGPIRDLRRLLYCGEWIESHALHVYMLHAPDFLGYTGAVEMARDHREIVEQGLRMKKLGNSVLETIGGRAIHPVNVRVGGFYKSPRLREVRALAEEFKAVRDIALATVAWAGQLDFPDIERTPDLMALNDAEEYPIDRGSITTAGGLSFPVSDFGAHVVEEHVEHSNALHARLHGKSYLTGPLARYNLAGDRLRPVAREAAREAGLGERCTNPFKSIIVRAVELVEVTDEAIDLIERYEADTAAGRRPRGQRGAARPLLPPLRDRRGRHDPRRPDRPANLAEPARDRGGPARRRERRDRPARRGADAALRAGDPQPRPVHLLCNALPRAHRRAHLACSSSASDSGVRDRGRAGWAA
jgi:sulfhydrogenase subunit alpha